MGGLRMGELLIILLIVFVLFGGAKLPQLGSSLGQAIRNFKKGFEDGTTTDEAKPAPAMVAGQTTANAEQAKVTSKQA